MPAMKLAVVAAVVCLAGAVPPCHGQEPLAASVPPPVSSKQEIVIPDGTPVRLRFARALHSYPWEIGVKKGEVVRLVVAKDVRVDGTVVIARGAVAQAVVATPAVDKNPFLRALSTNTVLYSSHPLFQLKVNWAASVDSSEIPLRPLESPPARAFFVQVYSVGDGAMARPIAYSRLGTEKKVDAPKFCNGTYIPAGTHVTVFVDGPVKLDRADVAEAQSKLPVPNETATLSVYRTIDDRPKCGKKEKPDATGSGEGEPAIYCDGRKLGSLAVHEYLTLELAPGKHTCRADDSAPVDISVVAGEEYFLRVGQENKTRGWQIQAVDPLEAEDSLAISKAAEQR